MATDIEDMFNKKPTDLNISQALDDFDEIKKIQDFSKNKKNPINKIKKNNNNFGGFSTQYDTIDTKTSQVNTEPITSNKIKSKSSNTNQAIKFAKPTVNEQSKFENQFNEEELIIVKKLNVPFLENFKTETQYKIISIVGLLALMIFVASILISNSIKERLSTVSSTTVTLYSDVQNYNSNYFKALTGEKNKQFEALTYWEDLASTLEIFDEIKTDEKSSIIKTRIIQHIKTIESSVSLVKSEKSYMNTSVNVYGSINEDLEKIISLSKELVDKSNKNDSLSLLYIQNLNNYAKSMQNDFKDISKYSGANQQSINNLIEDRKLFRQVMVDLYQGNSAYGLKPVSGNLVPIYNNLSVLWNPFNKRVNWIIENQKTVFKLHTAYNNNLASIDALQKDLKEFQEHYRTKQYYKLVSGNFATFVFFGVAMICIILLFYIYNSEKDNKNQIEKFENHKNQSSIFKLLEEMIPLQDGDLTKKTTVSEEITGAIADSINATIDSLSSLVKKIKDATNTMKNKTDEVEIISKDMLKTTLEQSESTKITSEAVNKISKAISEISDKTEESSKIAQESVKVSEEGVQQVLDSILSMKEINNNINETELLMIKVNDSSKQISEIVELLSEITEDTTILSLNATVQAARAGEAGEGFKIVADAIQKLAENAGEAARKVGNLIGIVQNDIQAVERAVGKTTEQVERGVKLSELTRESIEKMLQVTNNLADIVKSISEDAKVNQQISEEIAVNMNDLSEKIEVNKKSTEETASSISEISELSDSLRDSVQSFTVK